MNLEGRINREGYWEGYSSRECTICGSIFQKTSSMPMCHTCNSTRVKGSPEKAKMLRRARTRAKESGTDFTITLEDLDIPKVCPILGIELKHHKGRSGGEVASPSLDRVDNSKGYIQGNVQVISHLANQMKSNATITQLKLFAKWVFDTFGPLDHHIH